MQVLTKVETTFVHDIKLLDNVDIREHCKVRREQHCGFLKRYQPEEEI